MRSGVDPLRDLRVHSLTMYASVLADAVRTTIMKQMRRLMDILCFRRVAPYLICPESAVR
jgi:hypothetical protein